MSELTTYRPTTGVATLDPTGGRLVAWAQAASAANALAKSLVQTTFVPAGETVGNATAKILMGDELGLSPIASLRSIYVVHGTPALYARSMVALALSHGHLIWTEETSDQKVVVCGQRRGSDHVERSEWTIARATKAGYTNNKKYGSTPQEMLYSKAAAEVSRKVAADVLAGIPYSVEDLELEQTPTTTVTRGAVTTTPRKVQRSKPPEPVEPGFDEAAPVDVTGVPEVPDEPAPEPATRPQITKIQAHFTDQGIKDRDEKLRILSEATGRTITSANDLTKAEAHEFIEDTERAAQMDSLPVEDEPTWDTDADPTTGGGR